jgi:hypothetical protein
VPDSKINNPLFPEDSASGSVSTDGIWPDFGRTCKRCKEEKLASQFLKSNNTLSPWCLGCRLAYREKLVRLRKPEEVSIEAAIKTAIAMAWAMARVRYGGSDIVKAAEQRTKARALGKKLRRLTEGYTWTAKRKS